MNQNQLERTLKELSLGAIQYFDHVGSTNSEAIRWAAEGAPDLALLVANAQTAGRGRSGRAWFSPPEASLAFSLVLYPTLEDSYSLTRMTALGALAVYDALRNRYNLPAQVKWPNDVLIKASEEPRFRKVAGVLTEAQWIGEKIGSIVLGIGVNVAPASIPPEPEQRIPATCIEQELGRPVERLELLQAILAAFLRWRPRLTAPDFLRAWESSLAYRGEWVQISPGESVGEVGSLEKQSSLLLEGQIVGLDPDGALKLRTQAGEIVSIQMGEVQLKPAA